jgi:hypothetical protein
LVRIYLLSRGAESMEIIVVDRDPSEAIATWTSDGWEVVDFKTYPQPFPGVRRRVVYL